MQVALELADKAAEAMKAGKYDEAVSDLTAAIAAYPGDTATEKGWAHIWEGMSMAITLLQTAGRLN